MADLSQETKDFIRACEALHGRVALGEPLTEEEMEVIEFCAIDLLSKLKPPK